MLNLSSTPDQIIQEIAADIPHVRYWADRKQPGIEQWVQDTRGKAGPHVRYGHEFTSKNGNHWMMFYTQFQTTPSHAIVAMIPFIYYKTIGSIGVFSPVNEEKRINTRSHCGCLIFTSHFFRRLCERTQTDYGSQEMLMQFVLALNTFKIHPTKINEQGQEEVILKLAEGQGMGIRLRQQPMVVEIRTYLNESQLSPSQHKQLAACKRKLNVQPKRQDLLPLLLALCRQGFHEAGYIQQHDILFWERCKDQCSSSFLEASRLWDAELRDEQIASLRFLITDIANRMHLPHFDLQRFDPVFYKLKTGHYDTLMEAKNTQSLFDLNRNPLLPRF